MTVDDSPPPPGPAAVAAPDASSVVLTAHDAARGSARVALRWVEDDAVVAAPAPRELLLAHGYPAVSVDLLARRPRRSPWRAGVVMPFLLAIALAGLYAATTLLWPLVAVPPVVDDVPIAALDAPPTAVTWPAEGSAAVGVAGFDGAPASTADQAPMASITKLVTVLMILDQMPLAPGQSGPSFSFTERDEETYYDYLAQDESALDVPVDGSLTQYQMLQGILMGSAGNYTDRLASTIWPTDAVFARAASEWLARHGLTGITVVEPTGIDPANAADPASLIALARFALDDPVVAEIVRTRTVDLPGAGTVVNTNDLLSDPAVIGVKTGSLSTGYNLLAAREQTVGEQTVRAYAVTLTQGSRSDRDGETARLLAEVTAEASQPRVLPAGTLAGVVTTPWGATANVMTDTDVSLLLWNGATAPVVSDIELGDARTAESAVGSIRVAGPLGAATTGLHLTGDIPGPDAWWRLTHPLQLFGLAD
ncbi:MULTISPECIES: D-alanyl-D-alanine carboxypeptidase family protein [unclassified Microbacterium]|uniref:D-alanyl-D-alanine carboxypeptidase family protein n=1 Tax=unclassified Microbacterium TaxID=2609290 RepID=UPI00301724F6